MGVHQIIRDLRRGDAKLGKQEGEEEDEGEKSEGIVTTDLSILSAASTSEAFPLLCG